MIAVAIIGTAVVVAIGVATIWVTCSSFEGED
jgi:hypothetical protein